MSQSTSAWSRTLMRRPRIVACVLGLGIAVWLGLTVSWPCSARLAFIGGEAERKHTGPRTTIETTRTLFSGSVMIFPVTFAIHLRGRGEQVIEYSSNVSEVKILVEGVERYRGPPLHRVPEKGRLLVVPQWQGEVVRIAVQDRCSCASVIEAAFAW
ncbi:hypothetical protein BURK2_01992 [Burkholderiales bacterium]|nr:hypothetical protein BURK2_01992 [Burkholderiales bacterium]